MDRARAHRVWADVAARARREGATAGTRHACLAAAEAVSARGAAMLLTTDGGRLEPVLVTDPLAAAVEDVQVVAGEGPALQALSVGWPVIVGDIDAPEVARQWPGFGDRVRVLGVRSLVSVPMALGAVRVGVLDLVRDIRGEPGLDQLLDAVVYADTALLLELDARNGIPTAELDGQVDTGTQLWNAEVHQAAGMVSVQLGIPVLDALVRLRAHAYVLGEPLVEVARAVVSRRLRVPPHPAPDDTDERPDTSNGDPHAGPIDPVQRG